MKRRRKAALYPNSMATLGKQLHKARTPCKCHVSIWNFVRMHGNPRYNFR